MAHPYPSPTCRSSPRSRPKASPSNNPNAHQRSRANGPSSTRLRNDLNVNVNMKTRECGLPASLAPTHACAPGRRTPTKFAPGPCVPFVSGPERGLFSVPRYGCWWTNETPPRTLRADQRAEKRERGRRRRKRGNGGVERALFTEHSPSNSNESRACGTVNCPTVRHPPLSPSLACSPSASPTDHASGNMRRLCQLAHSRTHVM